MAAAGWGSQSDRDDRSGAARALNRHILDQGDVGSILILFQEREPSFNAVNISTALHRIARLSRQLKELAASRPTTLRWDSRFMKLGSKAIEHIQHFDPQELMNMSSAFATVRVRQEETSGAIAGRAVVRLEEFNPQALANTAWAFATLGVRQAELLGAIAGRVLV